jgi:outer membrane protein TolC
VFDAGKRNWNLGGFFRWNLFDGGRVRNRVAFEKEASDKALARWQQTVLRALEEVENAIAAYREERVRRDALKRSVVAARQSAELVRTLYTTGLTDFQNLLSMERSLLVQEDALAESNGLVVQNLVALYRALGGGWQPLPEALGVELKGEDSGG